MLLLVGLFALAASAAAQQPDLRNAPREPQRLPANTTGTPLPPTQVTIPTPPGASPSYAPSAGQQPVQYAGGQNTPPADQGVAQAIHTTPAEPLRAPPAKQSKPLPLARRGQTTPRAADEEAATRASGAPSLTTVGASMAIVLGLFFISAWVLRRSMPAGAPALPREVVEVLGRTPLSGRQHAHLLRLGNKLVLVSLSVGGAETIAEVTDPVEVDRLAGLCKSTQSNSSSDAFRRVFQQFAGQRSIRGFLGPATSSPAPLATKPIGVEAMGEEDGDV
ncbi:MAG: flagellar biosynthetic protein FliO [Planctomycetes bacterium]|nr:flagellar biosynthetic protein FliO [Planctomycetota bacterium]